MTPGEKKQDGQASYLLALYYMALRIGSRSPRTVADMYWLEKQGLIP